MSAPVACDVLVVGGGGAGLAAAITAAEAGRATVLIEKGPALGGSTGWSIGSVTAAGTPDQRAAGIDDSAAEHLADFPAWAGPLVERDNLRLAKVLADNAASALAWLRESGLEFFGPSPEPPHRKPRMHTVLPNSKAFVWHLSRRAERAGVRVMTNTAAERLVVEQGRVTGLEATGQAGRATLVASRGVVLAAGDFNASDDFKREFGKADLVGVPAINAHATGDAHRMAREVGAVVVNGDIAFGDARFRFAPPARSPWWMSLPPVRPFTTMMKLALRHAPPAVVRPFILSFLTTQLAPEPHLLEQGAILVNTEGRTFLAPGERMGPAIARQPGGKAWLLFDAKGVDACNRWPHFVSTAPAVAYAYVDDYRRTRPDLVVTASSIDALAAQARLPVDALRATIDEHNARAAQPIAIPPYLLLGPVNACTVLADGGLAVSERLEVVTAAGTPIPGLYAAGSTAQGGMLLKGHGHHLAWAFVSGRIAGASAAAG